MDESLHEEAFLDEVLGLFVLEAQEWIYQSQTALRELEAHPAPERSLKLYETIACGITNLGGSAATVELRDLEQLAFGLLPLLEAIRGRRGSASGEQLEALRAGMNGIIAAVQTLHDTKTGAVQDLAVILERIGQATRQPDEAMVEARDEAIQPDVAVQSKEPSTAIMDRLHDAQRQSCGESARHIVEMVVRKAKRDYGERGWRYVDAPTVTQILQELDTLNDEFVGEVRKRVPTIAGILADLKSPHAEMLLSNGRLEKLLQEIQRLHDGAKTLEAKSVMLFFHGLHSFLGILSQRKLEVPRGRLEAVEERLRGVLGVAQHWAEAGKQERAALLQAVQG